MDSWELNAYLQKDGKIKKLESLEIQLTNKPMRVDTYQPEEITVKGEMAQWLAEEIYAIDLEGQDTNVTTAIKCFLDEMYLFQKATGMNISEWLLENHPKAFDNTEDCIFGDLKGGQQ